MNEGWWEDGCYHDGPCMGQCPVSDPDRVEELEDYLGEGE